MGHSLVGLANSELPWLKGRINEHVVVVDPINERWVVANIGFKVGSY